MNYNRRCSICSSPLAGRKGHGFVTASGAICGNIKRHERISRQRKKKRLLDTEIEDMLYFELEVSDKDSRLLREVE